METDVPCDSEVFLARTLAKECYMRGNANGVLEVVFSPNGPNWKALDRAGWRGCGDDPVFVQFASAPECP